MKRAKALDKMVKKLSKIRDRIDKLKDVRWMLTDDKGAMDNSSMPINFLIWNTVDALSNLSPVMGTEERNLAEIAEIICAEPVDTLDQIRRVLIHGGLIYQDDLGEYRVMADVQNRRNATNKLQPMIAE